MTTHNLESLCAATFFVGVLEDGIYTVDELSSGEYPEGAIVMVCKNGADNVTASYAIGDVVEPMQVEVEVIEAYDDHCFFAMPPGNCTIYGE